MRKALFVLPVVLGGCELLDTGFTGIPGQGPEPPSASLRTVALTESPTTGNLAAYFCADFAAGNVLGVGACQAFFGAAPAKVDLKFGFELVFDMANPNSFPVPLVELLLGLKVFEGRDAAELGAVCVSFCDPQAEDCGAGLGCRDPGKTVRDIEDFVPTIDDLINIAVKAANGTLDDNLKFRVIPAREMQGCDPGCEPGDVDGQPALCCGGECAALPEGCSAARDGGGNWCRACDGHVEARVRFDLGIDPMLSILGTVAEQSADELLEGRELTFDIPYGADGSLFFDVPVLGRFALGYGPFNATWSLD